MVRSIRLDWTEWFVGSYEKLFKGIHSIDKYNSNVIDNTEIHEAIYNNNKREPFTKRISLNNHKSNELTVSIKVQDA